MLLTLFNRALAWISGSGKTSTIAVQGVLQNDTLATVHVDGQEPLERVRLVGVTNTHSTDTHFPWELNGLVILEDESQTRFLVKAEDIKMIIVPAGKSNAA
jgi:hypothetical protein